MEFPSNLQVGFDFRAAIKAGAIDEILFSPDCVSDTLCAQLEKFGIAMKV